jgi:hypothetical protein
MFSGRDVGNSTSNLPSNRTPGEVTSTQMPRSLPQAGAPARRPAARRDATLGTPREFQRLHRSRTFAEDATADRLVSGLGDSWPFEASGEQSVSTLGATAAARRGAPRCSHARRKRRPSRTGLTPLSNTQPRRLARRQKRSRTLPSEPRRRTSSRCGNTAPARTVESGHSSRVDVVRRTRNPGRVPWAHEHRAQARVLRTGGRPPPDTTRCGIPPRTVGRDSTADQALVLIR